MTVQILYWILCLCVLAFFGGWIARIDYMQYKADCEREARAEERRQARIHSEEFIKEINRNNTFNTWVAEAKGGAK